MTRLKRPLPKKLYAVLGVEETAAAEEIKKAYRALAKEHHPDVSGSPGTADTFAECTRAYKVLLDEKKRKHYDETGDECMPGETDVERQAVSGLLELFRQLVKSSGEECIYLDIPKRMKKHLKSNLGDMESDLGKVMKQKESMEKVRSKLVCKGVMEALLATMDGDIQAMATKINTIEHQMVVGKRALELLDLVSFEPEKKTDGGFGGFTTSTVFTTRF